MVVWNKHYSLALTALRTGIKIWGTWISAPSIPAPSVLTISETLVHFQKMWDRFWCPLQAFWPSHSQWETLLLSFQKKALLNKPLSCWIPTLISFPLLNTQHPTKCTSSKSPSHRPSHKSPPTKHIQQHLPHSPPTAHPAAHSTKPYLISKIKSISGPLFFFFLL